MEINGYMNEYYSNALFPRQCHVLTKNSNDNLFSYLHQFSSAVRISAKKPSVWHLCSQWSCIVEGYRRSSATGALISSNPTEVTSFFRQCTIALHVTSLRYEYDGTKSKVIPRLVGPLTTHSSRSRRSSPFQ